MAKNLRNVLALPLPEDLIEGLVIKTLSDNAQMSLDVCRDFVNLGVSLMRKGERAALVAAGWKIFKHLEEREALHLQKLLDAALVHQILNCDSPLNPHEVLALIEWCIQNGPSKDLELEVQSLLPKFLRRFDCDMKVLVATVNFLVDRPTCMSTRVVRLEMVETIVEKLAESAMPCQPTLILPFMGCVSQVEHFLVSVLQGCPDWEKEELLMACQRGLYISIFEQGDRDPSPALACVLQLVDLPLIPGVVKRILCETESDSNLARALCVLCDWLTKYPRATHTSSWVLALMDGLEAEGKLGSFSSAALSVLEQLFASMRLPAIRPGVEPVVWRMLQVYRFSPDAFHKVAGRVPQVMRQLRRENTAASRKVLQTLLDTSCVLMAIFPGYLELYLPILKAQEEFCQGMFPDMSSLSNNMHWMPFDDSLFTEDGLAEDTGRVGLNNLGNTCYMNSVLQALFMTRRFCCAVLEGGSLETQPVLSRLQTLFALLLHSQRSALSPLDVLKVSRPPWFTAGHQQDSSEFLIHLLDILHEQEKRTTGQAQAAVTSVAAASEPGPGGDDVTVDSSGAISRWTTEEDLSASSILQRKARSLADFNQATGDESLSCTLSVSADSGIHSVGGDEAAPGPQDIPALSFDSMVHQTFGGKMLVSYQCLACGSESVHTDPFTDIQLSFPDENQNELELQDLVDYFVSPEKLCGENSYNCDKCGGLRDGQRSLRVLQPPTHLVLTLKHFRYDHSTRRRTKLLHKVRYPERIELPVVSDEPDRGTLREGYRLYAAVVHSGRSMDAGHYYTFACDQSDSWYLFNDGSVTSSCVEDLVHRQPPDTPYILFYCRPQTNLQPPPRTSSLADLAPHLAEVVVADNVRYAQERREFKRRQLLRRARSPPRNRLPDDSDDNPPSSCGGGMGLGNLPNRFVY